MEGAHAWTPTTGVVAYAMGVPVCCVQSGSATYFWCVAHDAAAAPSRLHDLTEPAVARRWYLGDQGLTPKQKVKMKYRNGPTASWCAFGGQYMECNGWWRSPCWGARGNIKYEQSLWIDDVCVAEGLMGPEAEEVYEQVTLPDNAKHEPR